MIRVKITIVAFAMRKLLNCQFFFLVEIKSNRLLLNSIVYIIV